MTCDNCRFKTIMSIRDRKTNTEKLRVFCASEKCIVSPGFDRKCIYFLPENERTITRPWKRLKTDTKDYI